MFNRRRGLYTLKLFGFATAACLMNLRKKNHCGGFKIEHDGGRLKEGHPFHPSPQFLVSYCTRVGVCLYMLLWVPASRRGSAGFHISSCWLEQHGSCLSQSLPACQPDGNERGFINNVTVCASSHVFYVLYCQGFPSHFQGERSHVFQTKSSLALTVPCQTVVIMEQNFKM